MRIFSLLLILVLYALALTQSQPLADVRCDMNCDLQAFTPVCGTDDAGETKSFNNVCIMRTENCLRSTSFQKTADGICP